MTVIVTMAGLGKRFQVQGYDVPKFMIQARGKSLFEWSMKSLRDFFGHHFIFACLNEHDQKWINERAFAMGIHQFTIQPRNGVSLGQAQTAFDVMSHVDLAGEVWIYNIDTYIEDGLRSSDLVGNLGCAHVFESNNMGMSFVRFSESGQVIEIAEKKVISNWATVGMYGFKSGELYRSLYEEAYQSAGVELIEGEHYVAPLYQLLLRKGKSVNAPRLSLSKVHVLGTPEEVIMFDQNAMPPLGAT